MKKKNSKNWALVLILLLVISVGYAALSSNLKINGTTGVKNASWIIHWANPQVIPGSVTTTKPTLSESNTNATYSVTLTEPGDYYEFTIDAVNEGSIDAEILQIKSKFNDKDGEDIITEGPNRNLPAYIEYEVTHADNEHSPITVGESLDHGQTKTYRVRVAYSENINPEDLEETDITTKFYFEIEYKQREKNNETTPSQTSSVRYVTRQNEGQITPGDVVEIGDTELFYVISSDSGKTVLLSKNNLLVGNIYEDWNLVGQIQPNSEGYGLQSEEAKGYASSVSSWKGTVAFSQANYWNGENNTLISPYNENGANYSGNPYPFVYKNTYNIAPDFTNDGFNTSGYSIAYYVELYKSKLIEKGAPTTIVARLLSYEEADNVKAVEDNGKSIIFDGRQTYWLGSASYYFNMWEVASFYTTFDGDGYNDVGRCGVRPVIEIPTSEL